MIDTREIRAKAAARASARTYRTHCAHRTPQVAMAAAVMLTAAVLTWGCVFDDTYEMADNQSCAKTLTDIRLRIDEPASETTRSEATPNERMIDDACVLVFDSRCLYLAGEWIDTATAITDNGSEQPVITTRADISEGDCVIVLCNTGLNSLPDMTVGTTHMLQLNTLFPSSAWRINRTYSDSGRGMPMSGSIDSWVDSSSSACDLTRAVVKVQLAFAADLADNDLNGYFDKATTVWGVFNAPTRGDIYSNASRLSVPLHAPDDFTDDSELPYMVVGASGASTDQLTRYLPEWDNSVATRTATVADNEFAAERTCMIVRTGNGYDIAYRYFRFDFYDSTTGLYIDLNRNYHYLLTITSVGSDGYTTLAEALANRPDNVTYTLYDESDDAYVISSNGQYAVATDCDEVILYQPVGIELELFRAKYILFDGVDAPIDNSFTASEGITINSPALGALTSTSQPVRATLAAGFAEGTVSIRFGVLEKSIRIRRYDPIMESATLPYAVSSADIDWRTANDAMAIAVSGAGAATITYTRPTPYGTPDNSFDGLFLSPTGGGESHFVRLRGIHWVGPFSFTVDTSLSSGSGVGSYRMNINGSVLAGSSNAIDWGGEVTAVEVQTIYDENSSSNYAPVGAAPARVMVFPAGTNLNSLKATYATAGEYTISIYSSLPPTVMQVLIAFGSSYSYVDKEKVKSVLTPMLNQGRWLNYVFYECTNLTEIPADLFRYNTAATDFDDCFYGCSGLTGPIPADLFRYNTAATNFSICFYGCSGLTGPIPADLFRYNTAATDFNSCLHGCSGLTGSIPADLFRYNTAATNFNSCLHGCSGLTGSIPADMFRYNTAATNFDGCFYGCSKLTLNRHVFGADANGSYENRFAGAAYVGKTLDFGSCFSGVATDASVSAAPGTAPDLWNYTFAATTVDGSYCFGNVPTAAFTGLTYSSTVVTTDLTNPTSWWVSNDGLAQMTAEP